MNIKRLLLRITAVFITIIFITTNCFADINLGNDDGTGFGSGTYDNCWGVMTDSGILIDYKAEALRVTVYNANDDSKVFNTIDITANSTIQAVPDVNHFSDNGELIPKTTWLSSSFVGRTYNAIDNTSKNKFSNVVKSNIKWVGYRVEYIPELANLTIISENNSANLESIKSFLGKKEFIVHLCSLIGGGLTYEDFENGKYKLAFEPVAYFRYGGYNWALSATEVGIYNTFLRNTKPTEWNSTNNMKAKLGPLTHSNLPRAAFLESKDLNINTYSPTESDYYHGDVRYNTDSCIIRSMGIGVLAAAVAEPPESAPDTIVSQTVYHTDTDVYTSFEFVNYGEDICGSTAFSLQNPDGEYPKKQYGPTSDYVYIKTYYYEDGGYKHEYAYLTDETDIKYLTEGSIDVYVDNPLWETDEDGMNVSPYRKLGSFEDGEFISKSSAGGIKYTVKAENGNIIDSGTINNSCPSGETGMGWFQWHTPETEQNVTITITPKSEDIVLLDENGDEHEALKIVASIDRVREKTPPDPLVTDKRPDWQTVYNAPSVQKNIAQYAPATDNTTLEWYTWSYTSSWRQQDLGDKGAKNPTVKFRYVDPDYIPNQTSSPYSGAMLLRGEYDVEYWGIDNGYYNKNGDWKSSYKTGAVILNEGSWEKVTFSVSLDADVEITPSERCYTATYSSATGKYTMKSGYGFEIAVNCSISGNTELCTGSQAVNVLFPEFNYNLKNGYKYNRLLEKLEDTETYVFKVNPYSTYGDRVHFTPIWYPDYKNYTVFAEVFDIWCPAGQLSVRLADTMTVKGNVYDDWHIAPVVP